MSPVHVIVGEDHRAEAMWSSAFTGAVDLYRFPRNVDAFERLTAAEAPIDLVVLTPAQRGPFNLTADQFVARVLDGPLGASRHLANLHVIVVGQPLQRTHPRVMAVSTLDAAIRLVKFGELERAPRPVAASVPVAATSLASDSRREVETLLADPAFAGSIISRIWDAPAPAQPAQAVAPAAPAEPTVPAAAAASAAMEQPPMVVAPQVPAAPQLFTRAAPAGFIVGSAASEAAMPEPVMGGGLTDLHVGYQPLPGESIEVATGPLQPARPYQLPHGGGYRGPGLRAGQVNAANHAHGSRPVPPALADQVQSLVYGPSVGNPADPLLTWSSGARAAAAPIPEAAPMQQLATMPAAAAMPAQAYVPMAAPVPIAAPVVPLEPPPGVYAAVAPAQPAAAPAHAADPFLRRAEQDRGAVSFG